MRLDYVGLAYALSALVLGWDFVAPRVRLARIRREQVLRQRRDAIRKRA
jgi:hypothetical protein